MTRRIPFFFLICVATLALTACETDEGPGRVYRDSSGSKDTSQPESVDLCSNGSVDPGETDVDCGGTCSPCALGQSCGTDTDCASMLCGVGYVCRDAACGNGTQDPGETGLDCGGTCPACLGDACNADGECASGYCGGGVCATPTCTDGVKNGMETGTDCGGTCAQCPDGEGCVADGHCLSGFCKDGHCSTPSCSDLFKNQNESDVDCGGLCPGCAIGKTCGTGNDCTSGRCDAGLCAEVQPSCDDGQQNGGESDTDCGGACAGCGFGKICVLPGDCASGLCEQGICGAPATCNDGEKNGSESDIDCGGACSLCATGKYCAAHGDCLSETCIFGVCKEPTCSDGVQNQGESDMDCGGPCGACDDGMSCGDADDCVAMDCNGGVCISCSDEQKTGSETDVDCGGSCGPCSLDKACGAPGDCQSGACEGGICCTPNACGACAETPVEICDGKDNDCDGIADDPFLFTTGDPCPKQQGVCSGSALVCGGSAGWYCDDAVYGDYHARYEPVELACDGFDNDCDGQVDEHAACSACATFDTVAVDSHSDEYWYFRAYGHGWLTTLDGDAYMVVQSGAGATGAIDNIVLRRFSSGQLSDEWTLGEDYACLPSVASDGDFLHVGAATSTNVSFTYTNTMEYFKVSPQGSTQIHETVLVATADSTSPAIMVLGLGKVFMGYFTDENLNRHTFAKRLGVGTWEQQGTLWGRGDAGFQFVVQPSAKLFTIYADTFNDIETWTGGMTGSTGSSSIQELSNDDGYRPVLRSGFGDSLHTAFLERGSENKLFATYFYNPSGENYGWEDPSLIGEADLASLAVTPAGVPVMVWVTPGGELHMGSLQGSSWSDTLLSSYGEDHDIEKLTLTIDQHGRRHIAWIWDGYSGSTEGSADEIRYGMACATSDACVPQCGGKQCGSDSCGGSCGSCPSGQSCNGSGICTGGSDPCNGLTYEGCCDGDTVMWCESEEVNTKSCAGSLDCGWSAGDGYYWCNTNGGSDPSGVYPKSCP
jgi:hypothetical protein